MNAQDYIKSPVLGFVVLSLIPINSSFKDVLKAGAVEIAADIESASLNPNCTCRNKVLKYVEANAPAIGTLLFTFASANNILVDIENLFKAAPEQSVSGKVAKTTIKDWPTFTNNIKQSNLTFNHMSTSIVGDDVYVFFL